MKLHHRQKKDMLPQSVFTIPSELDVSLMLEFVGSVMLIVITLIQVILFCF